LTLTLPWKSDRQGRLRQDECVFATATATASMFRFRTESDGFEFLASAAPEKSSTPPYSLVLGQKQRHRQSYRKRNGISMFRPRL
jgi:hypothetical protein